VTVVNIDGDVTNNLTRSDSIRRLRAPVGPSFAVSLTYNGQTETTRRLGFEGRNTPPTAREVQNALNDLPFMLSLDSPITVTNPDPLNPGTYLITFARNEVQRVTFFGSPTGGSFQLTLPLASGDLTTAAIVHPGTAALTTGTPLAIAANIEAFRASIESALVAVMGTGNVRVGLVAATATTSSPTQFDITFTGRLRDPINNPQGLGFTNQPLMTVVNNLTVASPPDRKPAWHERDPRRGGALLGIDVARPTSTRGA
jgi:hypothetical protein